VNKRTHFLSCGMHFFLNKNVQDSQVDFGCATTIGTLMLRLYREGNVMPKDQTKAA